MLGGSLSSKITSIKPSVVAIGFSPVENQWAINGSGFCVSDDGRIVTAAHVYNQLSEEHRQKLQAFVMTERRNSDDFERYEWRPIRLMQKDDNNDIAVLQVENYENTLLSKLELGDSDGVDVGQDAYFIGFPYATQLMKDGFGVTLIVNKTIVSNVKRDGIDPNHPRNWFIVDAISNPGNSGCPLVDANNNKVIGVMTIAFGTKSRTIPNLDIKESMHIAGAKPINLAKELI